MGIKTTYCIEGYNIIFYIGSVNKKTQKSLIFFFKVLHIFYFSVFKCMNQYILYQRICNACNLHSDLILAKLLSNGLFSL